MPKPYCTVNPTFSKESLLAEENTQLFFEALQYVSGVKIKNDLPFGEQLEKKERAMYLRWALPHMEKGWPSCCNNHTLQLSPPLVQRRKRIRAPDPEDMEVIESTHSNPCQLM